MAQNFMARRSHFRILSLPLAVPITALVHIDLAGNGARDPGGNLWPLMLGLLAPTGDLTSAQIAPMRTGIDPAIID